MPKHTIPITLTATLNVTVDAPEGDIYTARILAMSAANGLSDVLEGHVPRLNSPVAAFSLSVDTLDIAPAPDDEDTTCEGGC